MAYTDVVPTSISVSPVQGNAVQTQVNLFSSAGVAVNLSSWSSFLLNCFPSGGIGKATIPLTSTSAITGNSTGVLIALTAAQTTALLPGLYTVTCAGKPTSGDDEQMLVTITLNVQRGD